MHEDFDIGKFSELPSTVDSFSSFGAGESKQDAAAAKARKQQIRRSVRSRDAMFDRMTHAEYTDYISAEEEALNIEIATIVAAKGLTPRPADAGI